MSFVVAAAGGALTVSNYLLPERTGSSCWRVLGNPVDPKKDIINNLSTNTKIANCVKTK